MIFANPEGSAQLTKVQSTTNSDLVGGWLYLDEQNSNYFTVITFIDESHFMLGVVDAADDQGGSGMERGTYSWDPMSGEFSAVIPLDTNGNRFLNPNSNIATVTLDGDTLTYDNGSGPVVFTHIK